MLNCEEILATLPRPTGDDTTEARTYKLFFDPDRFRTVNYSNARFDAILRISSDVSNSIADVVGVASSENSNSIPRFEAKNIDLIAYEFCRVKRILVSLELFYNQALMDFTNLKNIEVDYFIDPEISGREGIIFKLSIKDKPNKILKAEENFYSHIRNAIPVSDRQFFSLVYTIQ